MGKRDLEIGRRPEPGHSLEFSSSLVPLNPISIEPPATDVTHSPFVEPSLTAGWLVKCLIHGRSRYEGNATVVPISQMRKTEAQRGKMTCLHSHSQKGLSDYCNPGLPSLPALPISGALKKLFFPDSVWFCSCIFTSASRVLATG